MIQKKIINKIFYNKTLIIKIINNNELKYKNLKIRDRKFIKNLIIINYVY